MTDISAKNSKKKKKPDKGEYGYAARYKNRRIIITLICFCCILVDVLVGLIMFQTRATLFTVIACVMSLPFAKNLIGYIMVVKFRPLTEGQYERTERLGEDHDCLICYDISVSDSEKMRFFPCVAICGNNVIGLPQAMKGETVDGAATGNKAYKMDIHHIEYKKEYEKCLAMINDNSSIKARAVVCLTLQDMERELDKLSSASDIKTEQKKKNEQTLRKRLLEMGV